MKTLKPSDPGFAAEVSTFNTAVTHAPEWVVVASSANDVVEALNWARENGVKVAVQGGGHGAWKPVTGGLLITLHEMNGVVIDPRQRTATIAAGARWSSVVAAAAGHGLFPVVGSSPNVGVVGYLLGGGLGPLARSHGISSDYVTSFEAVTPKGEVIQANASTHDDLFWALRGGRSGGVVVTTVTVRLVELRSLYAGTLHFEDVDAAVHGWMKWTEGADPRVTTSAGLLRYPPFPRVPDVLRGKRLLSVHFAFPGSQEEGERLAAPLRALSKVLHHDLGEMSVTEVGRIHNDPVEPGPSAVRGMMLMNGGEALISALLANAGPQTPFVGVELRHLGEQTRRDASPSSAVSGRAADFALGWLSVDPEKFAVEEPAASNRLRDALAPWRCRETLANFIGKRETQHSVQSAWSEEAMVRLETVRLRYDPDQRLAG